MLSTSSRYIFILGVTFLILVYAFLWNQALAISVTATITATESVVFTVDTTQSTSEILNNVNSTSLSLSLPADVLSSGEEIRSTVQSKAKTVIASAKPATSGKIAANTVYEIDFEKTSDSSMVTSFDKAITLTFTYTDSDVTGIEESTLKAYRWNGDSWVVLSNSSVNASENTVTATSQDFSTFSLQGTAPVAPAPSSSTSSGGGGGGGGGGILVVSTGAIFKGTAYLNSDVTLLKDAIVVATTKAGPNAIFEIRLTNLSSGIHSFGVWAEDINGYRSITQTFTISITQNVTTSITGIFLPPTISVDKSEVRRGDALNILGQSAPLSTVTVFINSQDNLIKKVEADALGVWLYQLDTLELESGSHTARSRSEKNNAITTFSNLVSFKVGTKNVFAEKPKKIERGDVNGDNKVNLIDFSITAYWYGRPSPPLNIDLNNDGQINLVDFSIMAFYWTG